MATSSSDSLRRWPLFPNEPAFKEAVENYPDKAVEALSEKIGLIAENYTAFG